MTEIKSRIDGLSSRKRKLLARWLDARAEDSVPNPPTTREASSPPVKTIRTAGSAGQDEAETRPRRPGAPSFSLFFFSADADETAQENAFRYRLLIEAARFADRHGFEAVWIPERHFHQFGGLYPNPSVLGSALAMVTERLALRAGSVVLPLHHPVRVAEEWSVVDNLSLGRVGLAFASGWHAGDFVLFPENYEHRRDVTMRNLDVVSRLWRGERVSLADGLGGEEEREIYPKPIQADLPVWVTAAGTEETFARAGRLGKNLLTNLLGQDVERLAERIAVYRRERAAGGHDPETGRVTLMIHAFLGEDVEVIREAVRDPLCRYLQSFTSLVDQLARALDYPVDTDDLSERDMQSLLSFAFDRYFERSGLFGTPESCLPRVEQLVTAGVDEIACLLDFGVATDLVLGSLPYLDRLRELAAAHASSRASG
ncbi:MAG: LLM class flavin-dependent oxidoreductase [bacterium]